jgi:hypothetical protein
MPTPVGWRGNNGGNGPPTRTRRGEVAAARCAIQPSRTVTVTAPPAGALRLRDGRAPVTLARDKPSRTRRRPPAWLPSVKAVLTWRAPAEPAPIDGGSKVTGWLPCPACPMTSRYGRLRSTPVDSQCTNTTVKCTAASASACVILREFDPPPCRERWASHKVLIMATTVDPP